MLNTGRGGMENVFVDYNKVLSNFSDVTAIVHQKCKVIPQLLATKANVIKLKGYGGLVSSALYLRKIAKDTGANVIVAHGSNAVTISRLGLVKMNIKIISVRHTFFRSKISALIWRLKSDATISVNSRIANMTGEIGQESHLVYNAIGIRMENNIPEASCFLMNQRVVRIGFLGRMVERKAPHLLVKALGLLLSKSNMRYELYFGGEGKYIKALQNLVFMHGLTDKVHFLGYIDDKREFFSKIDIFCLPSLNEAFGLVLIESMAYGVPVVASNIKGIDEVVSHNYNGLLFTPGDYHDLALKIETLAFDVEKRRLLMKNGFEIWKNNYNLSRLSKDLYDVIKHVAGN